MHTVLRDSSFHPWYAVTTRPNHEKAASTVLQSKGYEQYLPLYRSRRQWSDRVVEMERPLFPGYVFCRFDAKQTLNVLTTPAVVSLVSFGNGPAAIADREIEAIRAVLRSGLPADPCAFVHEGQRIRVNRGSLEGVEGILMNKKNKSRIVISVIMLQRSISVEVDCDWIDLI
jgi:transcription antitermination factor NusG